MAQLTHHPAPGLGYLMAGSYVVPQNPIAGEPVTYIPRIGEILPAKFAVPQNPVADYMQGRIHQIAREPGAPGQLNGGALSGCGCGGSCGGCGGTGMGDVSSDLKAISDYLSAGEYMEAVQAPVFGIPLWGIAMGLVAVTMMLAPSSGVTSRYKR